MILIIIESKCCHDVFSPVSVATGCNSSIYDVNHWLRNPYGNNRVVLSSHMITIVYA